MTQPIVSIEAVRKTFGATLALDGVSLAVAPGEIHALVGENGAGKSTLIRILGGVHRPDEGAIRLAGAPRHFSGPRDAIAAGIGTIPQELRLVPALSVAENIALCALPTRRVLGLVPAIDRARMRREAQEILAQLGVALDPDLRIDRLSFAERQLVAIARVLRRRCRVLILDEPTVALERREIERLFAVLRRMREQQAAIIYISHRLDEIVDLADRCTVLRDGRVVMEARRGAFAVDDLVHAMTGRAGVETAAAPHALGDVLLEETEGAGDAIRLRAGEVVGLAGLLGSGADRILRRLFGADGRGTRLSIKGTLRHASAPPAAIAAGMGFVPGERRLGLVMNQSIRDNILLACLGRVSRRGMLDPTAGDAVVAELMDLLDIRPRRPGLEVSALSGGNQQKVIFAKWLAARVGVLLLDEPTQGIDVAAKAQIHALIRDFARRGGAALVNSSDLPELVGLCDAVLALRDRRIAQRLERADGLDEPRLRAAIGG